MPILRKCEMNKNFTQIPNELLRTDNLSLAAKGLLCYMLSCTDDWKFNIKGLSTILGETEYRIQKLLTELEQKGYHKKEPIKEEGKIKEWKYFVSDYPCFTEGERIKILPTTEFVDKPKKKNLYEQCVDVVNETLKDEELKEHVIRFLDVRIRRGRLSAKSWKTIVEELYTLAQDKETALEIVKHATEMGYMKFYPVNKYKKKNTFVDDITPVVTDDAEGLLRQKYIEEFSCVPKCDRPSFDEWRKEHEGR